MEWDCGSGVIDVFDWTSGIAYEIEPSSRPSKALLKLTQYTRDAMVKDVIIVPYNAIIKAVGTSDLKEWKKEIKRYISI